MNYIRKKTQNSKICYQDSNESSQILVNRISQEKYTLKTRKMAYRSLIGRTEHWLEIISC